MPAELAQLLQFLFNGIFSASVYALIALGLSLVFGIMRVGDLAQGGLYAVGAYATFVLTRWAGAPYALAVVLALSLTALLSAAQGRIYRRLRPLGIGSTFIGGVALLVIWRGALALGFSWDPVELSPVSAQAFQLGPLTLVPHKLLVIVASGLAMAGLWLFLFRTRWGRALRALSQNEEAALAVGVNAAAVSTLAFALAGALAGGAGALLAPLWPFDPGSGTLWVLKAFAIAVVGRARLRWVVGAALLVGVGEVFVQAYGRAEFADLVPFALLALVLVLQPQALGPEAEKTPRLRAPSPPLAPPRWVVWALSAAGAGIVLLLSLWAPGNYWLHLLIMIGLFVILANGLDLLTGYAGIPSLAQAGLWGVGAYASALLTMRAGLPFPLALLGAVGATLGVGALIGMLGLRLRGRWTSFTFLAGVVLTLLFENLTFWTQGTQGLSGVPGISLGWPGEQARAWNPYRQKAWYFLAVWTAALASVWLKGRIVRSRMGRALVAAREDEGLAKSVGIRTGRYQLGAFLAAAGFAGVAGSLYAHYSAYVHPHLFTFSQSFNLLVMNALGGAASLIGPLLGSSAVVLFSEWTRPVHATLAEMVFAVLLLLGLLYLPDGIWGGLRGAWRWRARRAKPTDQEAT